MKFKFEFDSDMRDTMEQCFKNEKAACEKSQKSMRTRLAGTIYRRATGMSLPPATFGFVMKSDTEAEVIIDTGIDDIIKPKKFIEKVKDYEKLSQGRVKVSLIPEEEKEAAVENHAEQN